MENVALRENAIGGVLSLTIFHPPPYDAAMKDMARHE